MLVRRLTSADFSNVQIFGIVPFIYQFSNRKTRLLLFQMRNECRIHQCLDCRWQTSVKLSEQMPYRRTVSQPFTVPFIFSLQGYTLATYCRMECHHGSRSFITLVRNLRSLVDFNVSCAFEGTTPDGGIWYGYRWQQRHCGRSRPVLG